jgi:hypothetical protein
LSHADPVAQVFQPEHGAPLDQHLPVVVPGVETTGPLNRREAAVRAPYDSDA